jgi:hypothetical protein
VRTWSLKAHWVSLKAGMFFQKTVQPKLTPEELAWYKSLSPSDQERIGLRLKRIHDTSSPDEFCVELLALFGSRGNDIEYYRIYDEKAKLAGFSREKTSAAQR